MTPIKLYLLVLLLHFISDFTLQGNLGNLKWKTWWMDECNRMEKEKKLEWGSAGATFHKYRFDYICGMVCHCLYWTIFTFAPIIWKMTSTWQIALLVVMNAGFHYWVDDMKANKWRLNLCQDQLFHLVQITATFFVWRC